MSRTAEDQQLLEERIQRMKQKNEELRRRHLEVEADKQSAAKQNALVKMSVPHDDDWIPGRHDNNPRQDRRHHNTEPSAANNYERSDERGQGFDSHRSWNENSHRDDSYYCQVNESAPHSRASQNSQNYAGKRNDHQGSRHRSDGDRYYHGHDNRQPGDWSGPGRSQDRGSYRSKERTSHSNRDYRNSGPSQSGEGSMNYSSTFPSKVFKNSSMESERGKRFSHRLAEGDGPPPDPSFSFLTDSMRDSQESAEKRKEFNSRRGFTRGRGRGGQSWNNRGYSNSRHDGFDARQETHNRPTDDAWRRERSLIDQERINRQKTSDGSWSREWDNNKVFQENDRTNRWKRGNQVQNYDRGYSQRGHFNNRDQRQNFAPKNDTVSVEDTPGAPELDESQPRSKFIRRGRFSSQNKVKDNSKVTNGVAQLSPSAVEHPNKIQNVCVEENTKTVENLQVSLVCDPSGAQKRCVEDLGGNLRISVSTDGDAHESTSAEIPHQRKIRKAKRNRILSSTSTGTTGTAGEDDESWEDLSTDEDVSVVHELGKRSYLDTGLGKSVDVSSGPESLDPIPAPGKEDEFLWDDFHPAGFQDNAAVGLDTEAAFKALLDEKSKQEDCLAEESFQSPKVSFRLDTSCLEDSGDDGNVTKLDPLLVTTQIVQAEVDCMSLTSIPTDSSLPEDITQLCKIISSEDGTTPEEDGVPCIETIVSHPIPVSAEEPSGPISVGDGFEPEPSEEAAKELCVVTENCDIKKTTENLHNDEENHPTNLTEQENKDPLEYALKQVGNTSDSHEQDSISNGEKGEVEIVERNRSSPSQSVKQSETSELNEISLSTESNDSRPENSPPNCDDGNAVHKKDVISVT